MANIENFRIEADKLQEIVEYVQEFEQNVDYLLDNAEDTAENGRAFGEYLEASSTQRVYELTEELENKLSRELAMLSAAPDDHFSGEVQRYKENWADRFEDIRGDYQAMKEDVSLKAESGDLTLSRHESVAEYLGLDKRDHSYTDSDSTTVLRTREGKTRIIPEGRTDHEVSFDRLMDVASKREGAGKARPGKSPAVPAAGDD